MMTMIIQLLTSTMHFTYSCSNYVTLVPTTNCLCKLILFHFECLGHLLSSFISASLCPTTHHTKSHITCCTTNVISLLKFFHPSRYLPSTTISYFSLQQATKKLKGIWIMKMMMMRLAAALFSSLHSLGVLLLCFPLALLFISSSNTSFSRLAALAQTPPNTTAATTDPVDGAYIHFHLSSSFSSLISPVPAFFFLLISLPLLILISSLAAQHIYIYAVF